MTFSFDDFAASVKAGGSITPRDTLALRQWSWADGKMSEAEADALFDLNDLGRSNAREWVDCFVEALSEYVVNGRAPKGYVDDATASWLMARIDKDGKLESVGELELVVRILERALNAPQSLKDYALRHIEAIVVSGEGATRTGDALRPGTIDPIEVSLLRRVLFASGGDGPAMVSRSEADLLFRLKDATLGADNAPEWKTLFVQAVANHLMAHSDYVALSRERAGELEAFMDDNKASVGGFLMRMANSDILGTFRGLFKRPEEGPDQDARADSSFDVTADEQAWLDARKDADGSIDAMEQALLDFIASEKAAGR